MSYKVLIGIPTYSGLFPHQTVNSLLRLHKPKQTAVSILPRVRIDKARNQILQEGIKADVSHVLFIDDDNPVPANALMQMLEDDKDIVTTPILQRGGQHKLCIFKSFMKKVGDKEIKLYEHIRELDTSKDLVKVDACGMGCTLIKISVAKKLLNKYDGSPFEFTRTDVGDKQRTMSEDVEFCERAVNEGFEIWCDTRIRPAHIGDPQLFIYNEVKY